MKPARTATGISPISVALGDYEHTRAFKTRVASELQAPVVFADVSPINRAFAPMVRELRFDICEMAIATFFMAKASGVPLVLLPAAVACRYQEAALLCRRDDTSIAGPQNLVGKRVGVRAYGQTTAMWLRGILRDTFSIEPHQLAWTVFEGAHVAGIGDPPFVRRAPVGSDLLSMLRSGELDAVIVGNELPRDDDLRTVFADAAEAARRFHDRYGFEPVNHVLVATRAFAANRAAHLDAFVNAFIASLSAARARVPHGRSALEPSVALALRYTREQGLLPRPLGLEEVWDGSLRADLSEVLS